MKKSTHFYLLVALLSLVHILAQKQYNANGNVQTFSLAKPKQTDCGIIAIDEDYTTSDDTLRKSNAEDENIDVYSANKNKPQRIPIANLSSCTSEDDVVFTSFSTRLSSQTTRLIFEENFYLDEKRGTVYRRSSPIDRERICTQVEQLLKTKNEATTSHVSDAEESIRCECSRHETCELRFRFVVYKN